MAVADVYGVRDRRAWPVLSLTGSGGIKRDSVKSDSIKGDSIKSDGYRPLHGIGQCGILVDVSL